MPTVETAGRWAHVVTVDYYSENCEPPSKHSMQVFLKPRVEQRDAAIRTAELARVVKRLREEETRGRELQRENACDGPLYARWKQHADSCAFAADLLEREGASASGEETER